MNLADTKGRGAARRIAEASLTHQGHDSAVSEDRVFEYFQGSQRFDNVTLPRLEKEFPWLHRRAATENDLRNFCLTNDIEIVFDAQITTGVYVLYRNRHFIFLNDSMDEPMRLHVMFHELAHCLFHEPTQSSFEGKIADNETISLNHLEAEIVSAVLLHAI